MSELKTIIGNAGTILIGQFAVMAYGVTDTIVAGRYSEQALAALSVGFSVYVTVFVALIGTMQALLPTWAELHGASQPKALGRSVGQALYLAGFASVAGTVALLFPGPILRWTEVPEQLQGEVRAYLSVLVLALPPALLFRMFSTLNQSLGKPVLVTWLQAASLLVKIPLSIWFTFGGLGLPAQGVVGCAWATVLVNYLLVGMAMWLLRTQDLYRPYGIWRSPGPPDWRIIADFLRLGVPAGLAFMVEVTSFTLMALFIARQGTVASAAHQITSNLAAVLYMVPLSIAIATSARVSFWMGAGELARVSAAIRTGLTLGLAMSCGLSATVLLARWQIAAVYSAVPEVVTLAAQLLTLLAVFHLGDATQALCVFLLRCYRVVIAPLLAYTFLLWGVGLTGSYMLAYKGLGSWPPQQSPAVFWAGSSLALGLLSLILPLILWRAVRSYRRREDSAGD